MKTTECIENINKRLDGIDKQLGNHIKHLDKKVTTIEKDIADTKASIEVIDDNVALMQKDMEWVKKFADGKIQSAYSEGKEPEPPQEPEEQIGFMYTWKTLLLPTILIIVGAVIGLVIEFLRK
jgi:hypothetical protein